MTNQGAAKAISSAADAKEFSDFIDQRFSLYANPRNRLAKKSKRLRFLETISQTAFWFSFGYFWGTGGTQIPIVFWVTAGLSIAISFYATNKLHRSSRNSTRSYQEMAESGFISWLFSDLFDKSVKDIRQALGDKDV